jgi:Uma2 family endonuclease
MDDFAEAEVVEGYNYELARGVIQVVHIPKLPHGFTVDEIKTQLSVYKSSTRGRVQFLASGSDCKLQLPGMESERHPDIALYLSPPPDLEPVWQYWIPEIVIEVVSPGQEKRDYEEKREEYLAAGVREYWIIDPGSEKALFLRRTGDRWEDIPMALAGTYEPAILPSLSLDLSEFQNAWDRAS